MVIEALCWSGDKEQLPEVMSFMETTDSPYESLSQCIVIDTLEGEMTARPGDWIIKGVKGEFYPRKPDIFEATYEKVDDVQ